MPRNPDVPCAGGCGRMCWRSKGCLPPGEQMCRSCRTARLTPQPNAMCAHCTKPFHSVKRSDGRWTEACSTSCATSRRHRALGIPPGGSPISARARWRKKNHNRRTNRRAAFDEVTPQYEAALRAKAKRCPLCQVQMTDVPYLPTSKELDHIVPVNIGGTHTIGNVRIICRTCNVRRPLDGSDYQGPVTLWSSQGGAWPSS